MSDRNGEGKDSGLGHGPFLRKIGQVIDLSNIEVSCIEDLHDVEKRFVAGTDVIVEGEDVSSTMIISEGWAIRYKMLSDGRRQILNFLIPGDIIGFYAAVVGEADHSVETLTPMITNPFEPARILDVFRKCPRLGAAIAWAAGRHDAILSEHITRVGRRSAYERTGHLLLELLERLKLVGRANDRSFVLPVTQEILADTLGLSIVHVNRTLRRLRENNLLRVDGPSIFIEDYDRLAEVAEFSPVYLQPDGLPAETDRHLDRV